MAKPTPFHLLPKVLEWAGTGTGVKTPGSNPEGHQASASHQLPREYHGATTSPGERTGLWKAEWDDVKGKSKYEETPKLLHAM